MRARACVRVRACERVRIHERTHLRMQVCMHVSACMLIILRVTAIFKTEVLYIGHQREELDIELEGKKLTQRDRFVYLGGAVCGTGRRRERYVEGYRPERTRREQLRG